MSRRSKQHTEEFKAEAVELVERSGKSVPEIAEELGLMNAPCITGLPRISAGQHLRQKATKRIWLRKTNAYGGN